MKKIDLENTTDEEIEKLFLDNNKSIDFTNWYDIKFNDYYKEYQVNHLDIGLNVEITKTFWEALDHVRRG